jgi:uncharacterized protein
MSRFNSGQRAAFVFAAAVTASFASAAISAPLTAGTYTEDFNSLAATGTVNTALPAGWALLETGGGNRDNDAYAAGTGSDNAGDVYSFGAAGSSDRALGTLRSGSLFPTIGVFFTNELGAAIESLAIDYSGEQWRLGSTGRADRLDFQYSLNATTLSNGDWIDFDALDISSLLTSGATGARFASAPVSGVISGLDIAAGQSFAFRWLDVDASGADDGLAVDDFNLVATLVQAPAVPEPASWAMMITGFGFVGGALRTRKGGAAKLAL